MDIKIDTLHVPVHDECAEHLRVEKTIREQLEFYHKLHLHQLNDYNDKTRRRNAQIKNLKDDNLKLQEDNKGLSKSLIERYAELQKVYKRLDVLEKLHSVK